MIFVFELNMTSKVVMISFMYEFYLNTYNKSLVCYTIRKDQFINGEICFNI